MRSGSEFREILFSQEIFFHKKNESSSRDEEIFGPINFLCGSHFILLFRLEGVV